MATPRRPCPACSPRPTPLSRAPTRPPRAETKPAHVRFQTETGSIYEITRDSEGMRWRRLSATLASGTLRNDGAPLLRWPTVRVGERCALLSEPFVPPLPRLVWTSNVVAILEREKKATDVPQPPPPRSLREVRVGDTVTRLLAGSIPMKLVVSDVDEHLIYCGGPGGWKFDRDSGVEVDEELGWGPQFGITGSYLIPDSERPNKESE